MANVIRQDVIEIGFKSDLKALNKINDGMDELKKSVGTDVNDGLSKMKKSADDAKKSVSSLGKDKGVDKLKNEVNKTTDEMKNLGGETKKSNKFLDRLKNTDTTRLNKGLSKVKDNLSKIAKKAGGAALRGLKKIASISFKAITGGIAACATAIGGLTYKAVTAYADYEQLIGGVETLLGAKGAKSVEEYAKITGKSVSKVKGEYKKLVESQKIVVKNANNAFKTAGLSANDYMETVTGFAASLLQSTGNDTKKAAKLADVAVSDMADNANKMGTDMSSIQWAYQGFAKQNYTMLDNLKLGYGGTKSEMQRLVKDAAKLDKSVDANSLSYANIVKAIHAVQVETGIYGTTQKEAEHTIQGSLNSLKSAWGNLMPALIQGGDEFDQCVDNLVDTASIFAENVKPAILKALSGIGTLIEKVAPIIEKEFPTLIDELLPPLLKAATSLVKGLIKALPNIIKVIVDELPNIAKQLSEALTDAFGIKLPAIDNIVNFFKEKGDAIKKSIPYLLGFIAVFKVLKTLSGFKLGGKSKGGNSPVSGFVDTFKQLGEIKISTVLKGMANLAIIIAGFTGIAALLMLVAPKIAQLSDTGSIVKLILVIGLLGLVGGALAKFTGAVGNIPIKTVLKGIANIALVVAAMAALYLLMGAVSLVTFNLAQIVKIIGIIGLLGTVGTVLTVFAGLAGMIPIAIVLKGIANIALVVAGMSALYLLIGAVSLVSFDLGQILKIVAIIGVLGVVGAALTVLAGIVGLIPIVIVLQGIANIALVVAGMSALYLLIGAVSLVTFDLGQLLIMIGIISAIGTVGAALTVLAGIVGLIPIPIVLQGIANIALVVAGMSVLFLALNTLAQTVTIDVAAVMQFVTITAAITAIGSSLAILAGTVGAIAVTDIITGIANIALVVAGTSVLLIAINKLFADTAINISQILQFVTIMTAVKTIAISMATFAAIIVAIPIAATIAGIAGMGLIVTAFAKISPNLQQFVISAGLFFSSVAPLPVAGFAKARLLFSTLSQIGSLPKTGGIAQFFTGSTDLSGLTDKLPPFGTAMAKFYTAIAPIKDANKIALLFKALQNINGLPKSGGFKQMLSGKSDLSKLGNELKQFGEDIKGFITQVDKINIGKLKGLWVSLAMPSKITRNTLKIVTMCINKMVDSAKQLPNKMGNAIKSAGSAIVNAISIIWKKAAIASAIGANKVVKTANFVLNQIDAKSKLKTIGYANGTNGHKGGNALVNDGRGAELVQMPNGQSFIPSGKNVFLPNAPKGMKVLPADRTAQLMGRKSPTYNYAKGTGDIDVWDYIDNPKGLSAHIRKSAVDNGSGFTSSMRNGVVNTITGKMTPWFKKQFDEMGALSLANYDASKGVEQWRTTVIRALKMEGQYSAANVKRTLYQMQTESGGNPRAINNWDSNAKKGTPSKGLMQVIDPTFRAYARKGFNKNIYDPLSNILASIRYALSRYGSLARAYQGHGYANGGLVTKTGLIVEQNKPEMVIPTDPSKRKRSLSLWQQTGNMLGVRTATYSPDSVVSTQGETSTVENNTYAPVFNLTVSGTSDDKAMARKVKNWVIEAMNEVFEGLEDNNPKLKLV